MSPDNKERSRGCLFVVATPIGNMGDITQRALHVLADVDRIAAEDTRTTGRLLARHGINTPMLRHEKHNEAASADGLVALMLAGESIALVSDAGTPAVSDPGSRLVNAARGHGLEIITVPGPSALTAAFSIAGFPLPLTFHGFVPKKSEARRLAYERLSEGTHAFYCPGRDLKTALEPLGNREVFVARELTKIHEHSLKGPALEVAHELETAGALKGEAVFFIHVESRPPECDDALIRTRLSELTNEGIRTREAVRQVAQALDLPRRRVYALAIEGIEGSENE